MNVYRKRPLFNRRSESNIYRMFLWVLLILAGIWMIREVRQGNIKPLFLPTSPPTRVAKSYALEGDAQFIAGDLNAAITAYREGTRVDPSDAELWAKLARIQTYSTALLTTDPERKARLAEALDSGKKAVELAPDDSTAHAIYAFVLDWNANPTLLMDDRQVQDYLTKAYLEATRALQLEPGNTLALAFNAEILVDQQRWTQADQSIRQALERDPSLMDVHRVHAYVLESGGQYNLAIEAYDRAIQITPNLTFLYLRAGASYRRLAFESPNEENQRLLYEKSLEYFAKTAQINAQLEIKDPIPYLSIAKTYSQMGEFFIAARNVQKALEFQPENADIYGQLGIIYFKSRNYEGSIPALKCAVRGCTPDESCDGRGGCGPNDTPAQVTGLTLSPSTVVYYYTYGSVLAALSRPKDNKCDEALKALSEVKTAFGADRDIAAIVADGELICASIGTGANSTNGDQPQVTVEPGLILETPTPTASP
ncbi:MAG: tetratricopeptide repeat protein [Anaerolineales bacterium]|nr:tetratricopeptide repeat protein [Anaerolineales bacterium]